jgi:endonuclease G, mitochondrial
MKRSWLLRRVTAAGIGLIALSAGSALAGCSCGFTAEQRARADKELWLNKKDQAASVSKHLPWGMPKNKAAGFAFRPLVQRDYVIGYSTELTIPVWTAHLLAKKTIEARTKAKKAVPGEARKNCFRADPRLQNGETAICSNYDEPVFDQGHLVPDADMPAKPIASLVNSYVFSNITPQYCHFNRGVWLFFEGMAREWAKEKGEVIVISGSIFNKNGDDILDASSGIKRLKANRFGAAPAIPTHFYKVVLHKTDSGELEAIAVLLPHNNKDMTRQEAKEYLNDHIVTIDEIERVAGLDLPPNVSAAKSSKRETLEKFLAPALWETVGGLPPTFDAACK